MKKLQISTIVVFFIFLSLHQNLWCGDKLTMRGKEEGKFFAFKDDTEQDSTLYRGESKLKLNIDYDFTDKISTTIVPECYYDTDNLASDAMDSLRERNERRYMFNLEEAYMVYSAQAYDVSVGKRLYTWGMADGFKPLDNLHSYELTDIPDLRKLGIFLASFSYTWPETSIDFVLVPFFTPSRQPEDDSRWAVSEDDSNNTLVTGGQFNPNATSAQTNAYTTSLGLSGIFTSSNEPRELPPKKFRNMQYGLRLKTTKRGIDFSLSYYDGFNNVSVVKRKIDTNTSTIHFIPTYNKMREIGGAFSTTSGQMEIHAEMTLHATDGQADDDYFEYVFGGSYTLDNTQIHHFEETKLFLEYAGEKVINYKTNKDYITYAGYFRPFRNSILTRLALKIDEDNNIDLSLAYNFNDDDSFIQPRYTHKFNDNWKIVAGLDVFTGESDSFFGKWDRNDRLFTYLTYSF